MATSLDVTLPDDGVPLWDRPEPGAEVSQRIDTLYFGANPCWSPFRENRRVKIPWACDLATGEMMVVMACANCRSGFGDHVPDARFPCANCLATARDARIAEILAACPEPDPDDAALRALAVVRADLDECDFVRSIEVATSPARDRANVVLVRSRRRLRPHERDGLPKEVDGVRVEVFEPGKRKQHQGDAA